MQVFFLTKSSYCSSHSNLLVMSLICFLVDNSKLDLTSKKNLCEEFFKSQGKYSFP